MAFVYLDTSALVKLCVFEAGSALAAALWDGADLVVTSRLADTEVRAVLAAGQRAGWLEPAQGRAAPAAWSRLWPGLHVIELRDVITARAATLVGTHPLRAADA